MQLLSQILSGWEGGALGLARLPYLHLNIGVGKVVFWRQFAVIIDEMVQDGGAQDRLEHRREDKVRDHQTSTQCRQTLSSDKETGAGSF